MSRPSPESAAIEHRADGGGNEPLLTFQVDTIKLNENQPNPTIGHTTPREVADMLGISLDSGVEIELYQDYYVVRPVKED